MTKERTTGRQHQADWPITRDEIVGLVATASRAPSLHNSQPWWFRASGNLLELHVDGSRNLPQTDPDGREMLISCGAALYGLRLGMRKLGYLPRVELLPDPSQPGLIARVQPGGRAPITRHERDLLEAMPHRHTHRGPFAPVPVPGRLVAGLCRDASAEGAALVLIDRPDQVAQLGRLIAEADGAQRASPEIRAELQRWTRPTCSPARDGVVAHAWAEGVPADVPAGARDPSAAADEPRIAEPRARTARRPEAPGHAPLPQRDFGLPGSLPRGGPLPSATAVLTTSGDAPADWLRAGQALHRMLLNATTRWVFARLQTQPLESPAARAELRAHLDLDGMPQMLMQFGRANIAPATARRPAHEILRR